MSQQGHTVSIRIRYNIQRRHSSPSSSFQRSSSKSTFAMSGGSSTTQYRSPLAALRTAAFIFKSRSWAQQRLAALKLFRDVLLKVFDTRKFRRAKLRVESDTSQLQTNGCSFFFLESSEWCVHSNLDNVTFKYSRLSYFYFYLSCKIVDSSPMWKFLPCLGKPGRSFLVNHCTSAILCAW